MLFLPLLCFLFVVHAKAEVGVLLNGDWQLKDDAGNYTGLAATVPGGIYSDLMNNNVLEDIYYGQNDIAYKWVARTNWTYEREFNVPDYMNLSTINLVFEGIDTYATIYINDEEVGSTKNMFVRYVFDVTDQIIIGNNKITVNFLAPIFIGQQLADAQEPNYIVPPQCLPDSYKGECHVNYLRKMQASYSWDWGPAFPSVGIWKNVYLEAHSTSIITDLLAEVVLDGDNWIISVDAYFSTPKESVDGFLILSLPTDTDSIIAEVNVTLDAPNEFGELVVSTNFTVPASSVQRWWPNGYGKQALYPLEASAIIGSELSIITKEIGFREITIVQNELDSGLDFYFEINQVPIFAMGANVIPINILPELSYDPKLVTHLITSVASYTEMNMLRVWGGGYYESDLFYELCDHYGLLVMQDFTFASSMYPAYDEFLDNVRQEVNHQVKRLQSHPSLVLWSGNNENEGNLASNYFGTQDNHEVYQADYLKLYIDTVRDELLRITKYANFIGASATNGKKSEEDGWVSDDPNSNYYGDKHYYTDQDGFDWTKYPTGRFISEYGFQSLPSVSSWMTVINDTADLSLNSDFMKHRQHHPNGNDPLIKQIEYNLERPSEDNEFYNEAVIFYSQIIQAVSTKIETEHYRRFMGRLNDNGEGHTMGALYWQLNDVWVAPTWAGIDFLGKWKMLHSILPTFTGLELVTGHYNSDNQLEIYHMLNKARDTPLNDSWIKLTIYKYDSFDPVNVTTIEADDPEPLVATLVTTIDVWQLLVDVGCGSDADEAKVNCFIELGAGSGDLQLIASNYFYPSKHKDSKLVNANVDIVTIEQLSDKTFLVGVLADAPALYVFLDSGTIGGRFINNGYIQTTPLTYLYFESDEDVTSTELGAQLTVTHLRNPKYFQ